MKYITKEKMIAIRKSNALTHGFPVSMILRSCVPVDVNNREKPNNVIMNNDSGVLNPILLLISPLGFTNFNFAELYGQFFIQFVHIRQSLLD